MAADMQKPRRHGKLGRVRWWSILAGIHLGVLGSAWAGPNAGAFLAADLNPASEAVDSIRDLAQGQTFWMAVRVGGAVRLDTYGFKVEFDRTRLRFLRASAEDALGGTVNFLHTRSGTSIGFIGQISRLDSNHVTVANSMPGSDSSKSPSGGGVLALLQFEALAPGATRIALREAELMDWEQTADVLADLRGASLLVASPTRSRRGGSVPARLSGSALEGRPGLGWYRNGRGWADLRGRAVE